MKTMGHTRPRKIRCPECGEDRFRTIRPRNTRAYHMCDCGCSWVVLPGHRYAKMNSIETQPLARYIGPQPPLTPGIPTGM